VTPVKTAPANAREALDMVRAGLGYLAAADPGQLPAATQAECLRELEQHDAVLTAARAWILASFTAGQDHAGDGDYSAVGKAVDLLAGPGGLASFLRRRQLGVRLAGPSLPLDIGYAETVPAGIRHAVLLRDRHCQWAGGCTQPAGACEVHHTTHKARGGKTSVKDCVLLCSFHHQVVIHRWGWTLVLNPTGPPPPGTRKRPKCSTATGRPPGPGNDPGMPVAIGCEGYLARISLSWATKRSHRHAVLLGRLREVHLDHVRAELTASSTVIRPVPP
jgi:hypothetical protein